MIALAAVAAAAAPPAVATAPPLREWQAKQLLIWTAPVPWPDFQVERCERHSQARIRCLCTEPPYLDILDEGLRDEYWSTVERRGFQLWQQDGGSSSPLKWRRRL